MRTKSSKNKSITRRRDTKWFLRAGRERNTLEKDVTSHHTQELKVRVQRNDLMIKNTDLSSR